MSEHRRPLRMNSKVCVIAVMALLLTGSLSIWSEATASPTGTTPANVPGVAPSNQATKPLGSLLNADGTLNLSSGLSGSIDTAGWQMVSAAGEPPRFVPSDKGSSSQPEGKPNPNEPEVAGDENWDGRFGGWDTNQGLSAVAVSGSDVYIGGSFSQAGGLSANSIAMWNSASGTWAALGSGTDNGTNGMVRALAINGNNVYVGGQFTQAGGVSANNVAVWNGSSWAALGSGGSNGTNTTVTSLAVVGIYVYVGGYFTQAGGASANSVAKWEISSGQWSALSSGTNGVVLSLVYSGIFVYVGGQFTQAGGVTVNNIARWNGLTWEDMAGGTNGFVRTLAASGNNVYAGGGFSQAGGMPANYVAMWNGSAWSTLGSGTGNGTNNTVNALAISGSYVYAGGQFTQAGGGSANHMAMWTGSSWIALGSGTNDQIFTLAVSGNDVYVGGIFTQAGGLTANYIALLRGFAWTTLGGGADRDVDALVVSGNDVFIGGYFSQIDGTSAGYVAKWDASTSTWSSPTGGGTDGPVFALAVMGGDVYVGGYFTYAGILHTRDIAKWNISSNTWSDVGGASDVVYALTSSGSYVYAGGDFTQIGEVNADRVAVWNGYAWSALSRGGVNDRVSALAVSGNNVYIGGRFTQAGGLNANYVAMWNSDTGTWSTLGSGTSNGSNGAIFALAVSGSQLYLGGGFSEVGSVNANHVAMWNGSAWSTLGSGPTNGTNGAVDALAVSGNYLYLGGYFTQAGGAGANSIAIWNGTTMSPLGSGTSSTVTSLGLIGRDLYVGGQFIQAGSKPSSRFGIWHSPVLPTPTPIPSPTPAQCTLQFEDVPNPSTFYAYVQCLACKGIINGYACGGAGEPCDTHHDPYFRPSHNVTRGQIAKIIALSANIHAPASGQTFEDVPPGSTFYTYTEQLYALQVMNGYPCGGPGEPCNPPNNRPYFRPNANATRGQLAKIDANAAGYNNPPSGQTFQDVAVASTFYTYTQRLTGRGVMSGYACGGGGEPCVPPSNLPYFRPNADVTRGQTSKIVGNTFYPDCQTLSN